jgi:ketosteroid isomerase-like protein
MKSIVALPLLSLFTLALSGTACSDAEPIESQATDSTVEQHIQIIEQRIAANNAQDWQTWEALHTEDAVRTAPELFEPLVGAGAMREGIEELVVTFPDYHLELVEAFGEGDRLVARIHTRATMLGPLDIDGVEVPPTGLGFEQDWVAVLTFEGDKIAAIDEFHDNYGILLQLGLAQ